MERLKDFAYAVKVWVKANPATATTIAIAFAAFVAGAVIF